MSRERHAPTTKLIAMATLVLFTIVQNPTILPAQESPKTAGDRRSREVKAKTAIKHKPLKYFVPWQRIRVEAIVTDPRKVALVRCYFRAAGQADYVFVGMKAGRDHTFSGILPAPNAETSGIEYLFLSVNGYNQVVKTQIFKTERKDDKNVPRWQRGGGEEPLTVSTELAEAKAPAGFSDSIVSDVAESAVRFGYVAGLYTAAEMAAAGAGSAAAGGAAGAAAGGTAGGASGGATAATSSGTVSASTGASAGAVVGVTAAAVAVVAVAAVGVSVIVDAVDNETCSDYFSGCSRTGGSIKACCDNSSCWYDINGRIFKCNSRSDCNSAAEAAVNYCWGRSVGTRDVNDHQVDALSVERLLFSTGELQFR